MGKGPEEVATEQDRTLEVKTETKTEAGTSLQQSPNRTVWFPKLDHPVSPGSRQKEASRTIEPGTAPTPCSCLPGLMPSQRRRIQQMRAQKMREEVAEKETYEHFNTIQLVILTKQEWRVNEKVAAPTLRISDDNMDLSDDDKSPLIKDMSPPSTSMDIIMVFTLSAEFKGVEEEVAQMCLDPKEAVFEKHEESSQHLKSLYVWGHIDGKLISRMLIDGGAAVNLMPFSVFKKLGREDNELVKTNLMLNGVWGGPDGSPTCRFDGAHHREQVTCYRILRCRGAR
jgi:hypothetical protein